MPEKLVLTGEYKRINPTEYKEELRDDPLWYMPGTPVGILLDAAAFSGKDAEKPLHWSTLQWETIRLIHEARMSGELALGKSGEFGKKFNDDDRWCPENWHPDGYGINRFTDEKNDKVEKPYPDTVVIHHTNTPPGFSMEFYNTLGMLRLYVPPARGGFPGYNNKHYALNSGHYDEMGNMVFHGYHYYIEPDGEVHETLEMDETGFHATHYDTNIRATGVALIGDYTNSVPPQAQLESAAFVVKSLNPNVVVAHQEIIVKGKAVSSNCPGKMWDEWKDSITPAS